MSKWQDQRKVVTDKQAQQIADAALFALRNGQCFNKLFTIDFKVAELGHSAAWLLFQDQRKRIADWLHGRQAGPLAYAAAFEDLGYKGTFNNYHVHYLLHIPHPLWPHFEDAQGQWLRDGLKDHGRPGRRVLDDTPIERYEASLADPRPATQRDYLDHLRRMVLYLMKGATQLDTYAFLGMTPIEIAAMEERFGDTFCHSDQGRISNKRVSVSQHLLSNAKRPSLHVPGRSWLDEAEAALEAGRALHDATRKLGDPPPPLPPHRKP